MPMHHAMKLYKRRGAFQISTLSFIHWVLYLDLFCNTTNSSFLWKEDYDGNGKHRSWHILAKLQALSYRLRTKFKGSFWMVLNLQVLIGQQVPYHM